MRTRPVLQIARGALCLALFSGGCEEGSVEDLQGTWSGTIICLGDTSDLSLGMLVDQGKIRGTGLIRTKGSNASYTITGAQETVDRLVECVDTPECQRDADCAGRLDYLGKTGNSRCNQQSLLCSPCFQLQPQRQVLITLRDDNAQIPDPILTLWRQGERLMEGTIKSFCADEERQDPKVKVSKE